MKTLALLAVLLGSTVASAQPADPEADSTTDAAAPPAEAPPPDVAAPAQAPVPQAVDEDLPPAGNAVPVPPPAIDARALPSLQPSRPTDEPVGPDEPADPDEYIQGGRRSSGVAVALSGGTTAAGIVMLAMAGDSNDNDTRTTLVLGGLLALAVGPTTGHIYAGDPWNTGLKARLSGLGLAVVGFGLAIAACPPFHGSCNNDGAAAIGALAFLGGGVVYAGGTIYEIVDAARAADRYNLKHRASITVVPGASGKPGVSVVGTF